VTNIHPPRRPRLGLRLRSPEALRCLAAFEASDGAGEVGPWASRVCNDLELTRGTT
jgi:hypothetical protein